MAFLQLLYKLQKLISNKKMTASFDTKFFLSNTGIFCLSKNRGALQAHERTAKHMKGIISGSVCVCVCVCVCICIYVFPFCVCVCVWVCVGGGALFLRV